MTGEREGLPLYLTVAETAELLRTTPKAIYIMIQRAQVPGVTHIGRRVLLRRNAVLDWLDRNCAPSASEESRR